MAIAEEEGLNRVEDSAIQYVKHALHAHLRRLVAAAPPVQRQAKRERQEDPDQSEEVISKISLRIAADKDGQRLLCDDLPLHRERLLLIDYV